MKRFGAWLAVAALFSGTDRSLSAQLYDADGWWNPVVTQSADGRVGEAVRDVVLGRAPSDRYERGRDDAQYGRVPYRYGDQNSGRDRNGNGPPFCRNGQGHPVHGWQWCRAKGWDRGYGSGDRWERAGWSDVIFQGPAPTRNRRIEQGSVADVLGDIIFGRVTRFGRDGGLSGGVDGRWLTLPGGGAVLQLRMGHNPLAELLDANRDGRADVVLLSRR